jgi:hypothetical protein
VSFVTEGARVGSFFFSILFAAKENRRLILSKEKVENKSLLKKLAGDEF